MPLLARLGIAAVIVGGLLIPGLLFVFKPTRVQEWEIRHREHHKWMGPASALRRVKSPNYPSTLRGVGVFLIVLACLILAGIFIWPSY